MKNKQTKPRGAEYVASKLADTYWHLLWDVPQRRGVPHDGSPYKSKYLLLNALPLLLAFIRQCQHSL